MNTKKLPQFLSIVDEKTKEMSHDELEKLIHEIARKLPENRRDDFIDFIGQSTEPQNDRDIAGLDDGREDIKKQILNIIPQLEKINHGEVCLDSEYNEEWDDWYNSDAEEILFSDPENLLLDVAAAINLIHKCIDMELEEEGCKLCETLCYLEIYAEGDYNDYDGSPLSIEGLFEHHLLSGDFETFLQEALYLTYVGNPLSGRADEMYSLFAYFHGGASLENILQMGNHELPEFDAFLPLWIEHLGRQSDRFASELLKEAQSMLRDDSVLLENARKFVNEHPELYLQILQMKAESDEDVKMLHIGLEAADIVPVKLQIRSSIALWTAHYASKLSEFDIREKCWLEAFRSDTSVINYMRVKFLTRNPKQYSEQLLSIAGLAYEEAGKQGMRYNYYSDNMREGYLSKKEYCAILFFEQEFDNMVKIGMSVKENLGWSASFMKEGMALLLLLLYRGNSLQTGMKSMLNRAVRACGFTKETFYFGTNEADAKTDAEVFYHIFEKWKDTVTLSDDEVKRWMTKIEAWIQRRVCGIMEANRRNYYGECAEYIASFGEVRESLGVIGAKAGIMEKYKTDYSRRRAFHEELRRFGMKK